MKQKILLIYTLGQNSETRTYEEIFDTKNELEFFVNTKSKSDSTFCWYQCCVVSQFIKLVPKERTIITYEVVPLILTE